MTCSDLWRMESRSWRKWKTNGLVRNLLRDHSFLLTSCLETKECWSLLRSSNPSSVSNWWIWHRLAHLCRRCIVLRLLYEALRYPYACTSWNNPRATCQCNQLPSTGLVTVDRDQIETNVDFASIGHTTRRWNDTNEIGVQSCMDAVGG